eukprot:gene17458-19205_t
MKLVGTGTLFIFCSLYAFAVQRCCAQTCRIDLGIILDQSGSIRRHGFEQEKKFAIDVARQLTISNTNTRVAVMVFSTHASMIINFRDLAGQNWHRFYQTVRRIPWRGGHTYTHKALDLARNNMFNQALGSRKGAPKMLLLLTDGKSQSSYHTLSNSATMLKNNFVNIMSIGIGRAPKRSELELIASRPIQNHVFQVADAYALSRIVSAVKTEACKPVTCWFMDCKYFEWSAWSGSCYTVRRVRLVKQQIRKSKMVVGGCAGLNPAQCQMEVETNYIRGCLKTCNYVKCNWGQWGAWSATCGAAGRQRNIEATASTTKRRNCQVPSLDCDGSMMPDRRRDALCISGSCKYVECKRNSWSQWSTSCGQGQRTRIIQTISKTIQRPNCHGLTQKCPSSPEIERRRVPCTCNYVDCPLGPWSQWTTSCGKGQRSRKYQTIRKTVQRESCAGLLQKCPSVTPVETRTVMCTCNYVDCPLGPWSQWTTSCGKGQRSRKYQAIRKTIQKESCAGLQQKCPNVAPVETRRVMCTCNYVECQIGSWSQWSTSCGKGQRSRKLQTIRKTVQRESCAGLLQKCPDNPDVQSRTTNCNCRYVECKYNEWSEWSPKCGKNMERKKTLQVLQKTVDRPSCSGLKQTCSEKKEIVETKTELCECDTYKCKLEWSAWSATCGSAQRTLRFKKVLVKEKKESCSEAKVTCPTDVEIQKEDFFCVKTLPPIKTDGASDATCHVPYKRIGCYEDNEATSKLFTKTLSIDRYIASNSFSKEDYLLSAICNCAVKARMKNFHTFALKDGGW